MFGKAPQNLLAMILLTIVLLGPNHGYTDTSPKTEDVPIEQKIGQMIMVGIRGTQLDAENMELTRSQISHGEIGGIIFFKHNIKGKKQFRRFINDINDLQAPYPLFLAVDEEGGLVRRFRKNHGYDEFPSAAHVGMANTTSEAYAIYSKMAQQINKAGLNLNLAPVVDVNINKISPAIGKLKRSFSKNPLSVYDYSEEFIRAHNDAGVLTTLKHYPGHGSSKEDSHNGITDITNTWQASERIPFQRLIDSSRVDIIMAGHLMDQRVDDRYPASISRSHIQKNLRDELGFAGVVITDDLQMGAVITRFELDEIIIAAVNAGCDILQFSDPLDIDEDLPLRIREIILKAIDAGSIDPQRIHESYTRIVQLKNRLPSHDSE